MTALTALETLYEAGADGELVLAGRLGALFGRFPLRRAADRPYLIANFVTTLDGVVSLNERGHEAAGDISGFEPHDRMVMGLLRAIADAIVVGAGTLRAEPDHVWSAGYIFPELAGEYQVV